MIIKDKESRKFLLNLSSIMRKEHEKQIFIDAGEGKDITVTAAYTLGDIAMELIEGAMIKGDDPIGYLKTLNAITCAVENETPWDSCISSDKAEAKFAAKH
jgi:hypothetical protein